MMRLHVSAGKISQGAGGAPDAVEAVKTADPRARSSTSRVLRVVMTCLQLEREQIGDVSKATRTGARPMMRPFDCRRGPSPRMRHGFFSSTRIRWMVVVPMFSAQ